MSAPASKRTSTGSPQIKICGITKVEEGIACASLGADAIGLVFYPKSPRCVDENRAADIRAALRPGIAAIGVFVDETYAGIMEKVDRCGLTGVQLHGREEPVLAGRLAEAGLTVIKALYTNREPGIAAAQRYPGASFLLECAGGALPGGNAIAWDWGSVRAFGKTHSMVLAGGLSPDNVAEAVKAARPGGVDVSSGVEAAPGRKDYEKVKRFIHAVHCLPCTQNPELRRIFL